MVPAKELDSIERKKRLFEHANANLQRRQRESFLASLPSDLRSYLAVCECVYSPDAEVILETFYPIAENDIGYRAKISPVGYSFRETSKVDDALAVAEQLGSSHDSAEGVLLLNPPVETWLEERNDAVLVPDLPLFRVSFGWVRRSYSSLWRHSARFIGLVRSDLVAGLIIDHYSGVLEGDMNDEELVYEVACWG
jgi:hypothetical protein